MEAFDSAAEKEGTSFSCSGIGRSESRKERRKGIERKMRRPQMHRKRINSIRLNPKDCFIRFNTCV
jgi:hypothetical protein